MVDALEVLVRGAGFAMAWDKNHDRNGEPAMMSLFRLVSDGWQVENE